MVQSPLELESAPEGPTKARRPLLCPPLEETVLSIGDGNGSGHSATGGRLSKCHEAVGCSSVCSRLTHTGGPRCLPPLRPALVQPPLFPVPPGFPPVLGCTRARRQHGGQLGDRRMTVYLARREPQARELRLEHDLDDRE